jgi:hypothetical protein
MLGSRTGSFGRSAFIFADESTRGVSVFGQVAPHHVVSDGVGDPGGALACAAAAMERAEQEIDLLWRHAMTAADQALSERLAEVSHALQRAARLIEIDLAIG